MNHYETLGVSKNASDKEIKEAYKKLVKKYHPDVYTGDKNFAEKKTKEINIAYDVLSNPESRAQYNDEIFPPVNQYTYKDNNETESEPDENSYEAYAPKYDSRTSKYSYLH